MVEASFNAAKWRNNVLMAAKSKDLKIGDLEAKAGLSRGYLSRFGGEDNKSTPNIEAVISLANVLKISLDDLINGEIDEFSNVEQQFLYDFLNTVLINTKRDVLSWKCQSKEWLIKNFNKVQYKIHGDCSFPTREHPLFDIIHTDDDNTSDYYQYKAIWDELKDGKYEIAGNFVYAMLDDSHELAITHVDYCCVDDDYEVFIIDYNNTEAVEAIPVVSSADTTTIIENKIRSLYKEIDDSISRFHLNNVATNVMTNYMKKYKGN